MKKHHSSRNNLRHTPARRRAVHVIARRHKIDPDDVLIILWDYSEFSYVQNSQSVIKTRHYHDVLDILTSRLSQVSQQRGLKIDSVDSQKPVNLILKSFDFSSIGSLHYEIIHITKDEVLRIHTELCADLEQLDDPISPSGVKDESLLDSALIHPMTGYEGHSKYSTIETAAASLMYALTHNHAFHNGNKRTAIVSMLVLLDRHGLWLTCDEDDLFKLSVDLADHRIVSAEHRYPDAEIFALAQWIHANRRIVTKGERPITLRKLKQRLSTLECEINESGRIMRTVKIPGMFGLTKSQVLQSKKIIPYTLTDGSEVDRALIKAIRQDLWLDTDHGVDSDYFYAQMGFTTSSEFIVKYSNLFKRLSRF